MSTINTRSTADFFTIKEVAERLRSSVSTIRRRIEEGEIRVTRHGRRVLIAIGDYWTYVHKMTDLKD
jgi:excisionase family DNA binding protein